MSTAENKPEFIQHAEKLELVVTDDGTVPEEEVAEVVFQQLVHDGRVTPSQIPDEYLSADTVHDRLDDLEKGDQAEAAAAEEWLETDDDREQAKPRTYEALTLPYSVERDERSWMVLEHKASVYGRYQEYEEAQELADQLNGEFVRAGEQKLLKAVLGRDDRFTLEEKHAGDLEDLAMRELSDWLDGRMIGVSRAQSEIPFAWFWSAGHGEGFGYLSADEVHTLSVLAVAAFRVGR